MSSTFCRRLNLAFFFVATRRLIKMKRHCCLISYSFRIIMLTKGIIELWASYSFTGPIFYTRVSQPGFRGTLEFRERSWLKKINSFFNLLAKINRSTEKYHSLLKRALTIIIVLLYLQLTDHAKVPWAVDIIIFMQGFPETWKVFKGFLQGQKDWERLFYTISF
jgi:hypothetical protein